MLLNFNKIFYKLTVSTTNYVITFLPAPEENRIPNIIQPTRLLLHTNKAGYMFGCCFLFLTFSFKPIISNLLDQSSPNLHGW